MNYLQQWEESHREKILRELREVGIDFTFENIPQIIQETSFAVRSQKHPSECTYYNKESRKNCHPEVEDLNCFLCACPNYTSDSLEGGCDISSKKGKFTYHPKLPLGRVWDCSDCHVNHSPEEVRRYLVLLLKSPQT